MTNKPRIRSNLKPTKKELLREAKRREKINREFGIGKGRINIKDLIEESRNDIFTDEEFKDQFRQASQRKVKLKYNKQHNNNVIGVCPTLSNIDKSKSKPSLKAKTE